MAFLKVAKTEEEIKRLTVTNVKKAYNELAQDYNKIIENRYILCPICGEFITRDNFYSDKNYTIGVFPECKKCIRMQVEQKTKKTDKANETKESVQRMLQKMNLPYIDALYETSCKNVADEVNEKNKSSAFLAYLVPIKSLPQYRDKTWKDSDFGVGNISDEEEIKLNQKTIRTGKKRFGAGFSNEDYMFLETQYQDWITRYECNDKSQEELFERLSFKKWEINKATKNGLSTKDLDKTYQELMSTANIAPRQSGFNSMTDAQTLGTLIAKWENERPLPEIDPELQDVDKIGQYIEVFFRGHMAEMLGLKNTLSHIYRKFMDKFTVKKQEYTEDENSEILFDQIFGETKEE